MDKNSYAVDCIHSLLKSYILYNEECPSPHPLCKTEYVNISAFIRPPSVKGVVSTTEMCDG